MALPTRYGSNFLLGTKGQTFAAGYDISKSGVVDGGAVVRAGNVPADSPITRAVTLKELADDKGESHGSKVIANVGTGASTTDRVGVSGAVAGNVVAGTTVLGYNASATEWVMRGGNVTTTLGGVANTKLVSGSSDYNGKVNDEATEVARTTISTRRVGSKADEAFDIFATPSTEIVPGRTKGSNAGDESVFVNPADGTDAVASEIAPSRAVPGELTYHFGSGAKPTTDEYKAKNVFEA